MPENSSEEKMSLILSINGKLERIVVALFPIRTILVFISSIFTVILSFLLAFYFRHDFSFASSESVYIPRILLIVLVTKLLIFAFFKLYEGMWRYVSIFDLSKILMANILSSLFLIFLIRFIRADFAPGFSLNVLVIDFMICFLVMSGKRMLARVIRESAARAAGIKDVKTILLGSTDSLNHVIQALTASPSKRRIIGVLNDEIKIGSTIRGITVLGKTTSAAKCAKKHDASEILLLPPFSTPSAIKSILDELELRGKKCELRMIPSYTDIADGNISVSHIKEVEIEDLLGRKPVRLDRSDVAKFAKGKKIMVTGAGGSIGSELCNQIAAYKPAKVVLFELSEFNLYSISGQLQRSYPELDIVSIIGDVRCLEDLEKAITENSVDTIYHAAAYKHVPLMEANPAMAVRTNVFGSANLADAAEKCGIKRVVIISTDKAVNPTSIMGATKRIAERIVLERDKKGTEFVVVRFGNVLGSSGSVIPRFKQQLKEGGPITVTSKNVVRYFMSIPEAVDLLLQAGAVGKDRDIMVLEMGEQIRIYDMAKKLIELSGMVPDQDIKIEIVGMRPGEKEYEELLADEEKVEKTPYDRIYVGKKRSTKLPDIDFEKLKKSSENIDTLKEHLSTLIPENKFDEAG
jgi:FlaA1/EpsC-like NDP-sugar epimerase